MLSALDLNSLKIDFSKLKSLKKDKDSILSFLSQQGINLSVSVVEDLTNSQIQILSSSTGIPQRIAPTARQKSEDENADFELKQQSQQHQQHEANTSVYVRWRYQLMACVLLIRFMRNDIAPSCKIIKYLLTLLKNDERSLKRAGICGVMTIFANNIPLLHFKNIIKNVSKYPNDTHLVYWNKTCYAGSITSNNIGCDKLPFLGESHQEYLDTASTLYLKDFLSDADNLRLLCNAYAFEMVHPKTSQPGTGSNR